MTPLSMQEAGTQSEMEQLQARLADAEARLAEAQELIQAIQSGDVDAVVVSGPQGARVFTLKGAEYAYRSLVESMNEGAATLSADGTVLYCNQHLSKLLGLPIEQIIGHLAAEVLRDENNRFESLFVTALCGDAAAAEIDLITPERSHLPVHVSLRVMKTDDPTAISMVVTDLTESKKWETMLAAGRLASSILESAAEAIAVCDENGIIVRGNKALQDLCGLNPVGKSFERTLPLQTIGGPAAPAEQFTITAAINGLIPQGQEMSLRREDGQEFTVLLSSCRIASSSSFIGAVLTLTDITHRKRVMQALIESEKLASVGRLASTIAHEINNPLEAIGNALYLAIICPETPPLAKSYLDMASEELERVTHVTRQTLEFHRSNNTAMLIDLRESLDGVLNLYQGRLRTRDIVLERRYSTVERIHGVNSEIRQIITNLLSNSLDALQNDGRLACRITR